MKNTLLTPPVAPLLDRLFSDAKRTQLQMQALFGNLSHEERLRRMADANANYREFYHRVKDVHMAVSPETGRLLYMLARGNQAKALIEFGTSFGLSTIHLAAALRDNGGGRLIGSELEPTKIEESRKSLEAAGLNDLVEIRPGDALESLSKDLPAVIDGVLLDGAKPLYLKVLNLLAPRLRSGAFLVADNADASPEFKAFIRDPANGYLSLPFGEDVELSMKLSTPTFTQG